MRISTALSLFLFCFSSALADVATGDSKKLYKPKDAECTVTSPYSENFFDLNKLKRTPGAAPPQMDWQVKGLDYGANFSINICAPVLADTSKVEGIDEAGRANVGAYYEKNGTIYSIGSVSTTPQFRGRKLILAYENGSPCPNAPELRKAALMSLMCDHEQFHKPSVAFVGQFNDCAYFFEVRTAAACPTLNQAQALGPGAVFGAIMGVFVLVYLVGGIFYQRTVMHARGWRQIPHYHTWAAILNFFWVRLFVAPILFILRILSFITCGRFGSSGRRSTSNHRSSSSIEQAGWKRHDEWA
ncbi:mannose-6-phosphate receptor binding domain-containing protein [Pyronema omphalodes]|nr:mannose-6-phosphate receptor binding domain-containing protein [Pyronema omphalodes]